MKKKTILILSIVLAPAFFISFLLFKIIFFDFEKLQTQLDIMKADIKVIQKNTKLKIGEMFFSSKITSNKQKNKFLLEKYYLPFKPYYPGGLKAVGFLELVNDKIIFTNSTGNFFYFNTEDLGKKSVKFNSIPNNLKDIIKNTKFWKNDSTHSIKDIQVFDNELFVSYTREVKKHCFNTSILKSKLDLNKLIFEEFFMPDLCAVEIEHASERNGREYLDHLSGGKIESYKNKLLFSHGDYQQRSWAQDDNLIFGKILLIDPKTKKVEHFSKGHRNPQGLLYMEDKDIILESEHGPVGGDEVNRILKDKNYGWPVSSYGNLPSGNFEGGRNDPIPKKTHLDHGFVEPLKYFVPSPGISELIYVPKKFNKKDNNILVGTMGRKKSKPYVYKAVMDMEFNGDFSKLIKFDEIVINERIRDMVYVDSKNIVVLVLENTPSIAILKRVD